MHSTTRVCGCSPGPICRSAKWIVFANLQLFLLLNLSPLQAPAAGMSYLDNGILKVGVDLDRGGSIGYLADVKKGGNVVNTHDFGRWIGQSYYSGPKPFGQAHPAWKDWPWNPVSGGDVYGHSSKVIDQRNDGRRLYVKTIPQQWALNNVPAECTFESWITLSGRTVAVRNRLTNSRQDKTQYAALDQELPALYTIGALHRLVTYDGDKPFSDAPPKVIPNRPAKNGPQWTGFQSTEHWAAQLDENDWGLGVCHPGVIRWTGGFYGQGGAGRTADDATGYIAPVRREILDHNIVYEYHYTLILDTLDNIRQYAYAQRPKSLLPDYHFKNDRQHWWLVGSTDSGYPIRDFMRVKVEQADPQMIGPEALWEAKGAPKLYIRAAYRTKHRAAQLFWKTTDQPAFTEKRSVRFEINPDGKLHTYEIDLGKLSAYRGMITGLRFDPVEAGGANETVDVISISHQP